MERYRPSIILLVAVAMFAAAARFAGPVVDVQPTAPEAAHAPKLIEPIKDTSPRPKMPQRARITATRPGSCEQYRSIVARYDWNVETAMKIMDAETAGSLDGNCNPRADNMADVHRDMNGKVYCIGSHGLFQISCHGGRIYDPAANIRAAYGKYKSQGWAAWTYTCRHKVVCDN